MCRQNSICPWPEPDRAPELARYPSIGRRLTVVGLYSRSLRVFIGKSAEERQRIFSDVKEMYRKRSGLFHGSYNVENTTRGNSSARPKSSDGQASSVERF